MSPVMGKEKPIGVIRLLPQDYASRVSARLMSAINPVLTKDGAVVDDQAEIQRIVRGGYGSVTVSRAVVEILKKSFLATPCAHLDGLNGKVYS